MMVPTEETHPTVNTTVAGSSETTMTRVEVEEDKKELHRDLSERLDMVNKKARHYRRLNALLLVVAVIFGLLASGLAGDSSTGGGIIAKKIAIATSSSPPKDDMEGWRNVYGIIAVLSFIATVATGLNDSLRIGEHQTKAFVCAGMLDGLLIEIPPAKRPEVLEKIRTDLAKLVRDYPDYFR
jgi:hypothetical protein